MELLNARGLWLLAGAAPLVIFYILKIQRQRVRVASTWLWAAAQRDLLAKQPFKKLVAELPLLLQLLALAALAVALARPAMRGEKIAGDHVAVVIDTSASMGTLSHVDGKPSTRMLDAERAAIDVVGSLEPGADAIIIEGGREARIVSPLERDTRHLKTAISALAVREVEGDLAGAVALAVDRLRTLGGRRRILVITDGALAHETPLTTSGIDTQVVTVGDAEDNAGIVRIDVRGGLDPVTHRDQAQVFVMVENYAAKPRDAFVTLTIEGRPDPVASRRVLLAPNEKTPVVVTFEPNLRDQGAPLTVQLSPGDALSIDDAAFGRVPAGHKMPVALVTRASYSWMARALDADGDVDLQRLTPEQLATVNVDPDALMILEGVCPDVVPGHDVVFVAPPVGACAGIDVAAAVEQPQITSWEAGDPRLRFLTLDGVHVSHATPLKAEGAGGSLLRAGKATLIADASLPGRTVTVIGFDVGDSDWPLKASFVLFVRNLVEMSKLHRAQGTTGPVKTGDPLRIALPNGVTSVRVESPNALSGAPVDREVAAKGGFAILPALEKAGFYRIRWTAPHIGSVLVAANLTSERESDVRPRPVKWDSSGAAALTPGRVTDAHHEWGQWLALLAAVIIAFDIFWLTRRTRASSPKLDPATRRSAGTYVLGALFFAPLAYVGLTRAGLLKETYVRFDYPVALAFVGAAGVFVLWRFSTLPGRMSRARRALVITFSSLAVLAAAIAVAEPELGQPLDRLTLILTIDRSRSTELVPRAEARIATEQKLAEKGMHEDDRIGVVVFGAEAATEDPPRPKSDLPPPQRVEIGRDGTDVEAAIRRALAELPADTAGRVVLISDGVQTRGDALGASAAAVAADVPVDVVILEQKMFANVRVVSVRTPTRANEGEPLDLRVVTSSAVPTEVELRIKRDGEVIHTGRAKIAAGEDVLRLRETANEPGLHRYDVEVTALDANTDGSPEDNAGSAFVRVRGPSLALVLEGDVGKGAPLVSALEANGFKVIERSTTGVPADVGGLAGFDLVVLSDVRASDLATSQIDALASYTKDLGGGLLLMGGDRSMGPGGYARTPIEDVSPVAFDLKEEKRRASLAEVIAIDISGSMGMTVGGQTKLALANEAAAKSASLLGAGDRLGVEHVDTVVKWTVPLGPVVDVNAIAAKIRAVGVGGGGIYTDISLRAAYAALENEKVNLKHLLLFADGDDAEQIAGCRALVKGGLDKGITTSVISLGRGHDTPELEVLSKIGNGRFYLIDDATKLPAVFTQETILASKGAIHEEPFKIAMGAPLPATRAVNFAEAPELRGYVTTVAKPRATVGLVGPEGDPVLATWSVGIGRASAFTSDFKDRWGSAWLRWPGAVKLFGQLARDTARKSDDPRVRLESDASGGELHVRADVVGDDGRAQTFRRLTVHVAGPDGFSRDVALEAVGAGRYASSIPLSRPGTYVATAKDEVSNEAVGTTGAVLTAGEELRPTGSDRTLLTRIATITGGKARDTLAGVYDDRAARRFAYTPLGASLILFSGVAMILGVGARRLAVPSVIGASAARIAAFGARSRKSREERAQSRRVAEQRAGELERLGATVAKQRAASAGTTRSLGSLDASSPTPPTGPRDVPPAPPTHPSERTLTAAEMLAKRRRERR
jgi:Ca-activated chloride channel family protein